MTTPSSASTTTTAFRSIKRILPAPSPHWVGDGFKVYPVFSNLAFTEELSPLLMFDYASPKQFPARPVVGSKPFGVGRHPHRGFETVTIAFQGQVEHQDSAGHSGVIGPGDVQWMTAGRGIIHEEYHSNEFTKRGGTLEMCQLWCNLPRTYKMTPPKYQSILNAQIPVVPLPLLSLSSSSSLNSNNNNKKKKDDDEDEDDDATPEAESASSSSSLHIGNARIIAGELGGVKGPATTFSPVQMWDVSLPHAGSEVEIPYPPHHTCIVFVRRGAVEILSSSTNNNNNNNNNHNNNNNNVIKASRLGPQDVALMRDDGSDMLKVRVLEPDSSILVMGGEPLNEPIAAQGPFVMNEQSELRQAFDDYRSGRMGQ